MLPLLLVAVSWFAVIRLLWTDWRIDPQYSYGTLVPLLVVGLLMKRWEDRPAHTTCGRSGGILAGATMLLSAAFLALVIPMAEANPDWRPLGCAAALAMVLLSLSLILMAGGTSWLKHFCFPICFFLIAVPWPRNFEQSMMEGLMSWNTGTTLEILHWFGYEALRQGNLIAIPTGIIGIEEACSGIRSLQSGLMVALFFGEVFRLGLIRRLLLLLISIGAALLGNILRNSVLAIVASRQGLSAVASWHDPAGILVLLLTVGSVFGAAYLWRQAKVAPAREQFPLQVGNVSQSRAFVVIQSVALVLLLISLLGTESWFRAHETQQMALREWRMSPRSGVPGVSPVTLSPKTSRMLFYPEGFSERWIRDDGKQGQVFYFRWPAGRTAVQAVSMHNPEVCLSSIGMHMLHPLAPLNYEVAGLTIPFKSWLFEHKGRPVYVYNTLMEDGRGDSSLDGLRDSLMGRLESLVSGRRNQGQRMVEVAFWNMPDEAAARAALSLYLSEAVSLGDLPTVDGSMSGGSRFPK
jgi:exosortase